MKKLWDAGKKTEMPAIAGDSVRAEKIYPRLSVDLDQCPALKADVDQDVELRIRGRVCEVRHNDWSHSMEIEVQAIGEADERGEENNADKALRKMRGK